MLSEYEQAAGKERDKKRAVKLPGETRHLERVESAKVIARRLAVAKRQRELEAKQRG
ncbi:hypothetical protein [Ensifer aridi]|uniref:hypothetical protein n=1 Tax=Ensifer aridi TaxID=1708715 RepID=UPI0015579F35|nr:hypothetical protein [Ensifer aridi]